ncbi:hypothetical protein MalM25_29850 [Planctomycetes bacterium MalM25]|nr:hypothetical protein MalM25_29850 [Planctomycetes bacterium MalM25]
MERSVPNPTGDPVTSCEANGEPPQDIPLEELDELLERLALGSLDPAGWRRLGDLIRGNRAAAMRYVRAAHDNETLREESRGGMSPRDSVPPVPPTITASAEEGATSGNAIKSDAGPRRDGWSLARGLPWGLAVCASFLMGWAISLFEATPEPVAAVLRPHHPIAMVDTGRSDPLGHITGLTPVASSDGLLRSRKVRSPLGRGEVFQLTRGAARLQVAGGEVLVEGPAVLSAIDTRTVFVRQGKVTVRHPGEITIQTPVAIATGQDATFSVVAEGDAGATFHTIAGSVLADVGPERGRCHDSEDGCVVGVGEAVHFAASEEAGVLRKAAKPPAALQAWDTATNDLHDYEKLVLSDEPLAYWPLYRVRRHRAVLDLTQNGHDGYAIGNWPTELSDVHATQSRGAYFDGESYIEADRKPPVNLRTGFTVESWARVFGGPEYQSVFTSRWVLESSTPQEQCFGFTVYAGANDSSPLIFSLAIAAR